MAAMFQAAGDAAHAASNAKEAAEKANALADKMTVIVDDADLQRRKSYNNWTDNGGAAAVTGLGACAAEGAALGGGYLGLTATVTVGASASVAGIVGGAALLGMRYVPGPETFRGMEEYEPVPRMAVSKKHFKSANFVVLYVRAYFVYYSLFADLKTAKDYFNTFSQVGAVRMICEYDSCSRRAGTEVEVAGLNRFSSNAIRAALRHDIPDTKEVQEDSKKV